MSAMSACLLSSLLLLAPGVLLLANHPAVGATARALPRSRRAAWVLFGAGALWFLWNIYHVGEADLLFPRPLLLGVFGALAALSFTQAPDFLAVRGLAVLVLLAAWEILRVVYMDYRGPVYPLKIVWYLAIVAALFLAGYPYRLRDFFGWLFGTSARARAAGGALTAAGLLLAGMAFAV